MGDNGREGGGSMGTFIRSMLIGEEEADPGIGNGTSETTNGGEGETLERLAETIRSLLSDVRFVFFMDRLAFFSVRFRATNSMCSSSKPKETELSFFRIDTPRKERRAEMQLDSSFECVVFGGDFDFREEDA